MLANTDLCGATPTNHDHDENSDHHHAWEDFVLNKPISPTTTRIDPIENDSSSQIKSLPKLVESNKLLQCPRQAMLASDTVTQDLRSENGNLGLLSKWTYYYHLPNDKTWDLASYKTIMSNIDSLDKLIAINENITDNIIKNCMLFVMKERITPMWEDSCNRNGGCFSYKVPNKVVVQVWRDLTYLMCGNALTVDPNHMEYVNGITISPKRGFCIVKVWMKNCLLQDPNIVVNIENLTKAGCLFKNHKAEF